MKIIDLTENLDYIETHPIRIRIESRHMPGGCQHNLICWLCDKNHAVYSMHPQWVFKPCWDCQKQYGLNKTKKWWEFWRNP